MEIASREKPTGLFRLGTDLTQTAIANQTVDNLSTPGGKNREEDQLQKKREEAYKNFWRSAELRLSNTELQSFKKEWAEQVEKSKAPFTATSSVQNEIIRNPDKETVFEKSLIFIIYGAKSVLLSRTQAELGKIVQKYDLKDAYGEVFQLDQFEVGGAASIKIGGVSLNDLIDKDNLSPASAYRFSVNAQLAVLKDAYKKILDENQTALTELYPTITVGKVKLAVGAVASSMDFDLEHFESFIRAYLPKTTDEEAKLIDMARTMIVKASKFRRRIFNTIISPASHDFSALRDEVENYLTYEDDDARNIAMMKLGLNTPPKIIIAYRRARELAQKDEFYATLANEIKDLIDNVSQAIPILTKKNAVSIMKSDKYTPDILPTLEELRKLTLSIEKESPKKDYYEFSPQAIIDWGNLAPPTEVGLLFPQGVHSKFRIGLHYQNLQGNILNLVVSFDTKEGELDWPFAESPDDPEMKDVRNTIFVAAKSLLLEIGKQNASELQERQKEKTTKLQTSPTTNPNGTKPRDEIQYIPRKKAAKLKTQRPLTPIQEVLTSEIFIPEEKRVKSNIVLPQEDKLREVMGDISSENQKKITSKIDEFNQKGIGTFKAIPPAMYEGKPVYELKSGKFRVLVIQTQNGNGDRTNGISKFEIFKIYPRDKTYNREFRKKMMN
ncbi:MAG: hypothetical protein Q7R31_00095 [Candidatus Levybacteria bacterium]|nr:hypothetical protein [Candidatus Levybacteria bacterium]